MLVILAVALIVVGPDKLPGLAKSLAKGLHELKRTISQVKEELNEEGNVLKDVKGELDKTLGELQGSVIDMETRAKRELPGLVSGDDQKEIIDFALPSDERPWEKDRKKEPAEVVPAMNSDVNGQLEEEKDKKNKEVVEEPQEHDDDKENGEINKK